MTSSELHAVMTGGFATIAGSVFALYVMFGIDAGHLMVASVMAAPCGLMVAKVLWPETEPSETMGRVVAVDDAQTRACNVVEAASNGAIDGLRLALNVAAMLIAFLGLVAVADWALQSFGTSLGGILGAAFWPIAAVMGIPFDEVPLLARLLGTKLALTELVAFKELGELVANGAVSERTRVIASFALCGFANVGSVAIQIGGLGAVAPERRTEIARLGFRAMFAGAVATCMTACIAGVVIDVGE
jgi:CNT family concentrative nucleoside transporter